MGKYNSDNFLDNGDPEIPSDYTKILTAIANELAEANRLKRLELIRTEAFAYTNLEDKA